MAPDGEGRLIETFGHELRADGTINHDVRLGWPEVVSYDIVADPSNRVDVTRMPRESRGLRRYLSAARPECAPRSPGAAACLLHSATELYKVHVVPADLASAWWLMLADEPDVRSLGTAVDRVGRQVEAFAAPPGEGGIGTEIPVILVDPVTGRLVGNESITLETDYLRIDGPAVTSFTSVTEAHFVNSIGAEAAPLTPAAPPTPR